MAPEVRISISALDEASEVFEGIQDAGERAADGISDRVDDATDTVDAHASEVEAAGGAYGEFEDEGTRAVDAVEFSWGKLALAAGAAGAAVEALNRSLQDKNRTLARTAMITGNTEDELRRLIVGITNVTLSTADATAAFEIFAQRGIDNARVMAALTLEYDKVADALGADLIPTIEAGQRVFRAFGGDITDIERNAGALAFAIGTTSLTIQDLGRFGRGVSMELQDLNLTFEDGLAALMALEAGGLSARDAIRDFNTAARTAAGDQEVFLRELRLTEVQLETYRELLEENADWAKILADRQAELFTPMQRLQSVIERLAFRMGPLIQSIELLSPLLLVAIPLLWGVSKAGLAVWGVLGQATKAAIALKAALAGKVALVLGAVIVIDELRGAYERWLDSSELLARAQRWLGRMLGLTEEEIEESIEATRGYTTILDRLRPVVRGIVDDLMGMLGLDLPEEYEEWLNEAIDVEAAHAALREEIEGLELELGNLEPRFQSIGEVVDFVSSEMEGAEFTARGLGESYDVLEAEIAAYEAALSTLIAEEERNVDLIEDVIQKLAELRGERRAGTDEIRNFLEIQDDVNRTLTEHLRVLGLQGESIDEVSGSLAFAEMRYELLEQAAIDTILAIESLDEGAEEHQHTLGDLEFMLRRWRRALEEARDEGHDLRGVQDQLDRSLGQTLITAQIMGDTFNFTEERIRQLREEIPRMIENQRRLREEGTITAAQYRQNMEIIEELGLELKNLEDRFERIIAPQRRAAAVMADVEHQIEVLQARLVVWGDDIDETAEKQEILTRAINRLLDAGISPYSDEVQDLIARLEELGGELDDTTEEFEGFTLGIVTGLERLRAGSMELREEIGTFLVDEFHRAWCDILIEGESFTDRMQSLFESFIDMLIDQAIRAATHWAIMQLFGEFFIPGAGGGDPIGALIGRLFGNLGNPHNSEDRLARANPDRGGAGEMTTTNTVVNHFNIQAADALSFADMLRRNPDALTQLIQEQLVFNGTIRNTIRQFT